MVSHCLNSNKARRPFSSDISLYDFYRYYETLQEAQPRRHENKAESFGWLYFLLRKYSSVCSHDICIKERNMQYLFYIYIYVRFFLIFFRYLFHFFSLSYNLLFILIRGQCSINRTDFCVIRFVIQFPRILTYTSRFCDVRFQFKL